MVYYLLMSAETESYQLMETVPTRMINSKIGSVAKILNSWEQNTGSNDPGYTIHSFNKEIMGIDSNVLLMQDDDKWYAIAAREDPLATAALEITIDGQDQEITSYPQKSLPFQIQSIKLYPSEKRVVFYKSPEEFIEVCNNGDIFGKIKENKVFFDFDERGIRTLIQSLADWEHQKYDIGTKTLDVLKISSANQEGIVDKNFIICQENGQIKFIEAQARLRDESNTYILQKRMDNPKHFTYNSDNKTFKISPKVGSVETFFEVGSTGYLCVSDETSQIEA